MDQVGVMESSSGRLGSEKEEEEVGKGAEGSGGTFLPGVLGQN